MKNIILRGIYKTMIDESNLKKILSIYSESFIISEKLEPEIETASDIALQTHFWQIRTGGESYFNHLIRTIKRSMLLGYSKNVQVVALLHDTLEDSPNPQKTKELIKKSFKNGNEILKHIELLTHTKEQNYSEYVYNVWKKSPKIAFKVKMLDMFDNITDNPKPRQIQKYKGAILYLLKNKIPKNEIPKQILKIINY